MSYLDDLKANQLLKESFYYVPGPDNIPKEDPFEGLTEELLMSDILTEEELSELGVTDVEPVKQILINLTHGEAAVGAAVAAAAILTFAAQSTATILDRLTTFPECKKYSGKFRSKCNSGVKLKKKIELMRSKITLCKNSKDPKKCSVKVQAKIEKDQAKLKNLGSFKLKKD